ncbi:MAG: PAS domain S-box protein [Sulfurospirillum sp.]
MSYNFLECFYTSMREGLYAFDENGKITHFNPSAQKLLGYSEEELIGKIGHFVFHAHNGNQGLLQCSLYKAFLQGKPYEGEEVFLTKDGKWITVQVRANPLCEEGMKQGYVVFFWEISKKDSLATDEEALSVQNNPFFEESDLEESEAFYEQIFETANLGIALLDKEGRFVALNPAYSKMYGYSEAELIGKHFNLLVPEMMHEIMQAHHENFLKHEAIAYHGEMESLCKGGKHIFVYATEGLLEHIIGGPYKIMTVFDITLMVEARRVQKEQEAMLVQQNKLAAMGEMIGHIAHQWRQPLNVMNLTTLDLKFKQELGTLSDEKLKSALGVIESLSEQMNNTINDFMNFYKPNKEKKAFCLYETVLYATTIVNVQLQNFGISLAFNIDPALHVHGLANELQQVILNLLNNAKDAFIDKPIEPKQICLVAWKSDESICLCVEDNAGGIEEGLLERIFEPYFTTKGKMQGSGIGLYICSMIMKESFGGRIKVENITHEGATMGARFILEFPRC